MMITIYLNYLFEPWIWSINHLILLLGTLGFYLNFFFCTSGKGGRWSFRKYKTWGKGGSGKLNLRENQRIIGANLCEIEWICGRLSASAQVFLTWGLTWEKQKGRGVYSCFPEVQTKRTWGKILRSIKMIHKRGDVLLFSSTYSFMN